MSPNQFDHLLKLVRAKTEKWEARLREPVSIEERLPVDFSTMW